MTAVGKAWYRDQGIPVPITGWLVCGQRDETSEYKLMSGELDIEEPPPGYDVDNQL
jgi:hypothetical protein